MAYFIYTLLANRKNYEINSSDDNENDAYESKER